MTLFFKIFFFPFSLIYSFIARLRNLLYDLHFFKSTTFGQPYIIAVGNLTVGGTGKTPFVEYLIELLAENYKIAVLSRGYGRKSKGFFYVPQDGDPTKFGDEPLQIKNKFKITVAVDENRVRGIKRLKEDGNFDVVILDDAFQHRRLSAHLKILLTDCNRPFYSDYFLPFGRLRDNKYRYKCANFLIFTKCPANLTPEKANTFLYNLNFDRENIFFTSIRYKNPYNPYSGKVLKLTKGLEVVLVTGIANPDPLIFYLTEQNIKFKHLKFSDHYHYNDNDVLKIMELLKKTNGPKIILVTEKDYVKLKKMKNTKKIKESIYVIEIKTEFLFNLQKFFNQKIKNYVGKNKSNG